MKFSLRSVGAPGQYGRWEGDGDQTDKGIVFAQTVEEGDRGAFYLASGGQGRLAVKLKPGQGAEVKDGGLVGVYHHITDEKLAGLLKKDSELADKKVDETLRLMVHKFAPEDRPAFVEWKKRWPDLHNRLIALASLPPVKKPAPGAAPSPRLLRPQVPMRRCVIPSPTGWQSRRPRVPRRVSSDRLLPPA